MLKSTTALSLDTLTENNFFKNNHEINLNHIVHIKKRF